MKKLIIFCSLVFILAGPITSLAQTTGDYQSHQTGTWSNVSTWERYNGSSWVNPAPSYPISTDGVITILNGHTVTVDVAITMDQLVVATGGTLTTTGGVGFTISGSSNTINGSFIITSSASVNAGTINVNTGSLTLTSGSISASNIIFDGTSSLSIPSGNGYNCTTTLIHSGTTTLSSPDLTGTMSAEVDVASQDGGDPAADLTIASGNNFTFNGDIKVRPTGTIDGPGTITYSGSGGSLGFINNGVVNADVKFQQAGGGSPKISATSTNTPVWNNIEIDDADGVNGNSFAGTPTITINGTLTLTNGVFSLGAFPFM